MSKKRYAFSLITVVLILTAILIIYDTILINKTRQTVEGGQDSKAAGTEASNGALQGEATDDMLRLENTGEASSQALTDATQTEWLVNEEAIAVDCNTPEYGLDLKLCENSKNRTFIRLTYNKNGGSIVNDLDENAIPELYNIFENKQKDITKADSYKISQVLLNPVHSQLYLLVHGTPSGLYLQTSFYVIDLNDMSIKKLFTYPGLYGKMAFNNDLSMLAYSFGDPPYLSYLQEDNLVEVYDCAKGEYIIKSSRDISGNMLGKNSSKSFLYDYEFISWQDENVLKLEQSTRLMSDLASSPVKKEVLYDIKGNLLLNPDSSELISITDADFSRPADSEQEGIGESPDSNNSAAGNKSTSSGDPSASEKMSAVTGGAIAADGNATEDKAESEPVKALKSFYYYLASKNDYPKAMKLLDENFRLRLGMLNKFGVEEIIKSDIDTEKASMYSELLTAAKFDTITKVETNGDTSVITYYQLFGENAESQVRQLISAELDKTSDGWKIILVEDGKL